MRTLFVSIISSIIFALPLFSQASANPTVYGDVKAALLILKDDPEFGALAQSALDRLPYCSSLLQRVVFLPRKERYQIDVITYDREPAEINQDLLLRYLQSQERVQEILDSLNYRVVGYEGTYGDSVSIEWLEDYFWQQKLAQGWAGEKDSSLQREVKDWMQYDGVFTFMLSHKKTWVVGIQDRALAELYSRICYDIYGKPGSPRKDLVELKSLLEKFRCEIALARVMEALSKQKERDRIGVVVIGYLPVEYIAKLLQLFQVKSTVYDARIKAQPLP